MCLQYAARESIVASRPISVSLGSVLSASPVGASGVLAKPVHDAPELDELIRQLVRNLQRLRDELLVVRHTYQSSRSRSERQSKPLGWRTGCRRSSLVRGRTDCPAQSRGRVDQAGGSPQF